MDKQTAGFTIVELVTVIIIIGIMSVVVLPKFTGSDSFEPYAFRTQLISALRLTQQRAMQQTNSTLCHQIIFNDSRYGVADRTNCSVTNISTLSETELGLTGAIVDTRYNIKFDVNGVSNKAVSFDGMGRPKGDCDGGCTINITQTATNETVSIKIESEGYIHAI
ncbi:Tfp pilus assembly protein FimT/FimU [Colwelliaceae bacterium 6471]